MLELQGFEVVAEGGAQFRVLQGNLHGGFQETEFVSRIVGNSLINVSPKSLFLDEKAQRIGELNFVSGAGLDAFQAIENRGWQNVAAGDGEIRWRFLGLGFFHEVANAQQAVAEGRLWSRHGVDDAVEMRFIFGNLFDGNGANASGLVNTNELSGGGVFSRDEHIAEKNGERFVADKIARDKHGVAESQRLFLARVADLHHVADLADHFRLIFLAVLFQKMFQGGRGIEMVFDGIFAFAGDDDDVLDAGSDALFSDVLNLRLVHDGEHFFGLRFGRGEEARAEARGREDGFADAVLRRDGFAGDVRRIGWHIRLRNGPKKVSAVRLCTVAARERFCQ